MTDSIETIRCSNCKRDILSSNFVIHDIHCQRNIYLCIKCNEPVNHNQKAEHDEANHKIVFCTSCHAQLEKFKLNNHLINDCPKRIVKCQICDIEIAANDISEHENYCGARTEKCQECGEYVMLKYTQLHLDSNHTFIKLSDEPGPSPSWQNGRRTLGNFLPDLDLLSCPTQQHQKKKHGRNESSRRRSRESSEFMHKDKIYEELPGGEEKHRFHQKNVDRPSSSKSQDVKRKVGSSNFTCTSKEKTNSRTEKNPLNYLPEDTDDSSLKLAMKLSKELNGDCQNENSRLIAQAIEENTAVLSEFSLLDCLDKKKSGNNLSKNINSCKTSSKTILKSQLASYADDSSDDELLLYSKRSDDMDEAILPCQFCSALYPSSELMAHQELCDAFENVNVKKVRERFYK